MLTCSVGRAEYMDDKQAMCKSDAYTKTATTLICQIILQLGTMSAGIATLLCTRMV